MPLSHDSGGYDQESASFPNEMKLVNAIDDAFKDLNQSIVAMEQYAHERSKSQQLIDIVKLSRKIMWNINV